MKTDVVNSGSESGNLLKDLIDGCKAGDQKSQFQIYKLYNKSMYNTSLMIVNSAAEARDIILESFLVAFEMIETYSGNIRFDAWLRKIVLYRSLQVIRENNTAVNEALYAS
jgi:RNA polymerase sigma-70 factor (ECF subfamily)